MESARGDGSVAGLPWRAAAFRRGAVLQDLDPQAEAEIGGPMPQHLPLPHPPISLQCLPLAEPNPEPPGLESLGKWSFAGSAPWDTRTPCRAQGENESDSKQASDQHTRTVLPLALHLPDALHHQRKLGSSPEDATAPHGTTSTQHNHCASAFEEHPWSCCSWPRPLIELLPGSGRMAETVVLCPL